MRGVFWTIRGELPGGCIHHSAPLTREKAWEYFKFRRTGSSGNERGITGVRAFDLKQKSSVHLPDGYSYLTVQLYGIYSRRRTN